MRSSFEVVLEEGLAGRRLWYRAPETVICAWTPDEVADAFREIEDARRNGLYLAGYFSYELGYLLEARLSPLLPGRRRLPLLQFGVFARSEPAGPLGPSKGAGALTADHPMSFDSYRRDCERVLAYIAAGDVYQVNLSFPVDVRIDGDSLDVYRGMQARQPNNHGALVHCDGTGILSCSPELFFRVSPHGKIEARPMKGTAARGATRIEDRNAMFGLAACEKSRAENLMIVDLLRNDISRLSKPGTVKVPGLFAVETYPTLFQMTSTVTGELSGQPSIRELVAALFPCGSITGAPKVRAMEIIAELERHPRGIYCGAIGHICPDGEMAFNVAIRTLTVFDDGTGCYNVGSGIVADSQPLAEYRECLLKAQIILRQQAVSA